jgi:hypothetical protein
MWNNRDLELLVEGDQGSEEVNLPGSAPLDDFLDPVLSRNVVSVQQVKKINGVAIDCVRPAPDVSSKLGQRRNRVGRPQL